MITVIVGKEVEKIKGDFESYLNGLNMVGEITYSQYSELYDEGIKQIQKAYELGKSELEHQLTHRNCVDCSNHSSKLRMRTLELEKENAFLKGRNEGFELQIMGLLIKYEEVYKRFPDLKSAMDKAKEVLKENAEFKKQRFSLRNERNTFLTQNEQYEKDLINSNDNLTKAKEIIEGLMRFCRCFAQHHTEDIRYKDAEQFLKEIK